VPKPEVGNLAAALINLQHPAVVMMPYYWRPSMGNGMRISAVLTGGAVLFAFAGQALAAGPSDWEDCKVQLADSDRSISGCTRIINGDKENDQDRAIAYSIRASVYLYSKGDTDGAIADENDAIRLDPKREVAYANRGLAYLKKGNYDLAIADCNQAISINPKLATAYDYRGSAYSKMGNYDVAIADYNQAISINPKLFAPYGNRASAYSKKGNYDLAVADYNQAISIEPKNSGLYFGRGRVNLYAGSLDKSQADLNQANVLAPKHAYAALWLDIVSQRNKLPSRLPQTSSQLDMMAWPAPVIKLFMGQTTSSALLAAAESTDPNTKRKQLCEANFYTGELALIKGSKAEAIGLLRLAASDCPHNFDEWDGAKADLKLLVAVP
jgi:lipoprotein NlpI